MSRAESPVQGSPDKSDQGGVFTRRIEPVGETTEGGDSLTRLYTPVRGRRIYIYIYIYIFKRLTPVRLPPFLEKDDMQCSTCLCSEGKCGYDGCRNTGSIDTV